MREMLSADDVFSELGLLRTSFSGALVLLEGSSDCSVIDGFIASDKCRSIPAHSKKNVIDIIVLARRNGVSGVLGIVDADFDRLNNRAVVDQDICVTDYHDLELGILLSGVMNRLIAQYCDAGLLTAFLNRVAKASLIDAVLECASSVGVLRWVSSIRGLNLNFQQLDFTVFMDRASLAVLQSDLIRVVVGNTRNCTATPSALATEMAKLFSRRPDLRQVSCGHDVSDVMSIALRHVVGKCVPAIAEARNIERMCRMAYAASDFAAGSVYLGIKAWETRNAPYTVLKF